MKRMKAYKNYIGLDAHKDNCYMVIMDHSGKVIHRKKFTTTEGNLLEFIRSVKGSKALVFEETALSQWLYLLLRHEVDYLAVCQAPKKKAKTDFRDAIELADLLRVNRLSLVYHDADRYMELRDLIHGYDCQVQQIVRSKNRLKALFNRTAIKTAELEIYTNKEAIKQLPTTSQQFVAKQLFEQIQIMEDQKKEYKRKFTENLKQYKEMRVVAGIPGFAEVLTNRVVAYMVTPHRFPTKYNLFSYAMLIRHKQMSDGTSYGKKRAIASRHLKGVFKTAVNVALQRNNAFRRKYDEMLIRGVEERCARNSVTKSLAATVLGVWKSGKRYRDSYWEVKRRSQSPDRKT